MALRAWKSEKIQMGAVIMGEGAVSDLDFSRDGKHLVMCTKESSIHIIDALAGIEKKKIYAKSHGVSQAKFTHHDQCLLISTEKKKHDIRYISMFDNRYLRFYSAHTDKVTSISMNPTDDYFVSSSLDKSVCLWSLSSTFPIAKLSLPSNCEKPYAAYDASGLVFGVLCFDNKVKSHSLKLFDARSFDSGPFQDIIPSSSVLETSLAKSQATQSTSLAQRLQQISWTGFEFSPDGQRILVNTSAEMILSLDSFSPDNEPVIITNRKNDSGVSLGACFSADGQSIISGNEDNELIVYDNTSGEVRQSLAGHVAPVGCVRSNPRFDLIASGCVNTALWI